MALIHCPECDREISTTAESCPSCGYVLVKNELPKIRRTELLKVKKNPGAGVLCIVIGIIVVLFSIPFVAMVIGIFGIIGGLALVGYGGTQMKGTQKGTCPYCNNAVEVGAKDATFKCPLCKKTSTRNADSLESID